MKSPPSRRTVLRGHCGHDRFDSRSAVVNTRGLTFFGLDWLDTGATVLACAAFAASPESPGRPKGVPGGAVPLSDSGDRSPNAPRVWVHCVPSPQARAQYTCPFHSPESGAPLSRRPYLLARPLPETRKEGATPGGFVEPSTKDIACALPPSSASFSASPSRP